MATRTAGRPARAVSAPKKKAGAARSGTSAPLSQRAVAKLSIPWASGTVVSRERLFAYMNKEASHPLLWVCGPPGSGKTTLIASYLARQARGVLWYRADEHDIDLPTVFHNLREAALAIDAGAAARLPLLTAEYLLDIPTFARNFLRALFDLLPRPAALAIDNIHDVPDGTLDTILKVAVEELPRDVRLFAISRNALPQALSSLQVRGQLATLQWDDLRLTVEEADAIGSQGRRIDAGAISTLHALCDGWVAGFVLLLEHARRVSAGVPSSTRSRASQLKHFFGEIFATAPESARQLLLCTALLPSFTLAQAAAFASHEPAQQVIGWLTERNFFIDSRTGAETVYRYHDLFREFLLERGKLEFSAPERLSLLMKAARSAEESGEVEDALDLAVEAQAWEEATRLIFSLAPLMLRQGRNASLDRLIGDIAPGVVAQTPWLLYWRGVARLTGDPAEGRELLQSAFAVFEQAREATGSLLSCASILQSFFLEWGDQHPIDPWVGTFRRLWSPDQTLPPEIEAQILPQLIGVMLRHAGDPLLRVAADRARQLIHRTSEPSQIVALGYFLAFQLELAGKWAEGAEVLTRVEQAVAAAVSPLLEMLHCTMKITWHAMCADYGSEADGRKQIQRFLELRAASGIHTLDVFGLAQGIYFALNWQDQALAESLLEQMRRSVVPRRIMDVAHYYWHCAAVALQRGDAATARVHARTSLEQAVLCGTPFGISQNRLLQAQIEILQDRPRVALEQADFVIAYGRKVGCVPLEYSGLLVRALAQLRSGSQSEGLQTLREGLALGRSTGQTVLMPTANADVISCIYSEALRNDIEADYVRPLVKRLRIAPQSNAIAAWPWPIRVYTLGRFALVKDEIPMRVSGKAQRKPLNLLLALIALGGRSVRIDSLIRQVWPSSGAAARPNFNIALVRLRRLLGRPDALLLAGGKLTLNERICWVDSWSFERAVSESDHGDGPLRAGEGRAGDALDLYRGRFLPAETDLACVDRMRDRLAAKFQRMVLQLGKDHEAAGRFDCAAQVYGRGLEEDNLVEAFYQRLIYCEWKQGNRAEAVRNYRRCTQLLASSLHIKPSRETEALYRRLIAD